MGGQAGLKSSRQSFSESSPPAAVLRGIILALAISVVLLFIFALLFYFTTVSERITPYLVFAVSAVAIFSGSSSAGKKIGHKGWLYGGITGSLFVALLLVIGIFVLENVVTGWSLISKLFIGFVFGTAGGMWGVNRK
ncbi:MAG: TIGR04086 family membrane protein [Dethiobacter sp.]|jgi:putative membrane protein (TIGR04086 family)|nr:TIGR04086 family membrane protein [Dethiobacter sp.]